MMNDQQKPITINGKQLYNLYRQIHESGTENEIYRHPLFFQWHTDVYESGYMIVFNWLEWEEGRKNIADPDFDFTQCHVEELGRYITAIFRSERFMEDSLQCYFADGTLNKVFHALSLTC